MTEEMGLQTFPD